MKFSFLAAATLLSASQVSAEVYFKEQFNDDVSGFFNCGIFNDVHELFGPLLFGTFAFLKLSRVPVCVMNDLLI